ncbi:MAG: twin-arginine translocation signal domain-containing protein, partial [Actinomycetota bacterium]|nr:twin-arginine translocation signal domain-containing protein [Actinomycetota bacterium]
MRPESSTRSSRLINRRDFLKLGGAGLAGVTLLTTVGSGSAPAQGGSSLVEEFEEAAERYRIPKELLLAMGYVNTRWE